MTTSITFTTRIRLEHANKLKDAVLVSLADDIFLACPITITGTNLGYCWRAKVMKHSGKVNRRRVR